MNSPNDYPTDYPTYYPNQFILSNQDPNNMQDGQNPNKESIIVQFFKAIFVLGILAIVIYFIFFYKKDSKIFNLGEKKVTTSYSDNLLDVRYLDRHDITCGNNAINNLKYGRNSDGSMNYTYQCTKDGDLGTAIIDKETALNDNGGGNAVYLDRHKIECDNKYLLSGLKLNRKDDTNQIQYKYKCVPSNKELTCTDKTTYWQEEGNGDTAYLDRHFVDCGAHGALSKLHLVRNSDLTRYKYNYTCCNIK